jgi:hypothetical protein
MKKWHKKMFGIAFVYGGAKIQLLINKNRKNYEN